jgi:hypothetical protein
MKRLILVLGMAVVSVLAVCTLAQWQVQPQVDPRVGPIYPKNPSYNFQSRSNYDPFQFNWASGTWNYAPIPYNSAASSGQNWQYTPPPNQPYSSAGAPSGYGQAPYVYGGPPPTPAQSNAPSPTAVSPNIPPPPTPDDSAIWSTIPSTQPSTTAPPKPVTFQGRIVAIKAVEIMGCSVPHVLLRLRNDAGAMGTADVGMRIAFPDAVFDPGAKGQFTVTGQLGVLDGHLVLFADTIVVGSQTILVQRNETSAPPR